MTLRDAIIKEYNEEFKNKEFLNNQSLRISAQGYGADPAKTILTFTEFLDSYFGEGRLTQVESDFDADWPFDNEVEHIGNVLDDNIVE